MATPYGWVITKDIVCDGDDKGIIGPSGCNLSKEEITKGERFTMYDDDGECYYEGYIVGDYTGLEPLDDFGMPNAGCTEIKINGETV